MKVLKPKKTKRFTDSIHTGTLTLSESDATVLYDPAVSLVISCYIFYKPWNWDI